MHIQLNEAEKQEIKSKAYQTSNELYIGSIASFVGGVSLVISFISPYWLQSWEDTQSPFKKMGIWEFCFYKFRHPDYQFDHLFHGCHPLYGEEFRLIREKLLPGWLMVVQLFITISLILSFLGQLTSICLLLRCPLEWILRFDHPITSIGLALNASSAVLTFLSVCIFGAQCWDRDWLLYPNYNFLSYSYAVALFSCTAFIVASLLFAKDARAAKERKPFNKALLVKLNPKQYKSYPDYAISLRSGGSGFL